MSKAFIRSMDGAIKRITDTLDRLMHRKHPEPSDQDSITDLDSVVNILYGLREEELEVARFNNQFLENGYEENDELDAEDQ